MDPATIAISIAACKKLIDVGSDLKSIGSSLDTLFNAKDQHDKAPKKKKLPKTRMQQVLRMRSGDDGYDDTTSISAVANDLLQKRQTEMALKKLGQEIDKKYGLDTWLEIQEEQEKRIKEHKIQSDKAKKIAKEKAIEDDLYWSKVMVEGGKGAVLLIMILALILSLFWIANK